MCVNRDRTMWHRSWPQRNYQFNKYARRTLKRKGWPENYIEDVVLELVWNAAGGRCEACELPVDLDAPLSSLLKAQFDHRYPLCWGGRHEQRNVQLLHQACHKVKSKIKRAA